MMTHREHDDRDAEPSGMTVFTAAVTLFFVISILLLLGSVVLALSPLLFIFYVGLLALTVGSAYYYARDRWC